MAAGPLKILLVEDNFAIRRVLQKMLEVHGSCDIAVNGSEALHAVETAHLAHDPYHLICLDIMMPELDGREALRKIRQIEEGLGIFPGDGCKVIMTTALNDAMNVMGSFSDQCDGYLIKPIVRQKLVDELDRLGLLRQPPQTKAASPAVAPPEPSETPARPAREEASLGQLLAEGALLLRR